MTDELKPCPFCGATNVVICNGSMGLIGFCRNCGTTAECGKGKYEATKKWNTRPIEDALVKALEVARREIIECLAEIESVEAIEVERASGNDESLRIIDAALALAKRGRHD